LEPLQSPSASPKYICLSKVHLPLQSTSASPKYICLSCPTVECSTHSTYTATHTATHTLQHTHCNTHAATHTATQTVSLNRLVSIGSSPLKLVKAVHVVDALDSGCTCNRPLHLVHVAATSGSTSRSLEAFLSLAFPAFPASAVVERQLLYNRHTRDAKDTSETQKTRRSYKTRVGPLFVVGVAWTLNAMHQARDALMRCIKLAMHQARLSSIAKPPHVIGGHNGIGSFHKNLVNFRGLKLPDVLLA